VVRAKRAWLTKVLVVEAAIADFVGDDALDSIDLSATPFATLEVPHET